jgi:hypothetical protein
MRSIKLGNVAIDGEVQGKGWKMALELKAHLLLNSSEIGLYRVCFSLREGHECANPLSYCFFGSYL